jgi:predicted DNA-binding transcriptional regulator YafY
MTTKEPDTFTTEEALAYTLEIAIRSAMGLNATEGHVANALVKLAEVFPQHLRDMSDDQLIKQQAYSRIVVGLFKIAE